MAVESERGVSALAQPGLRGKTIWLLREKITLRELFDRLAALCTAEWYRVGDSYVLARSEARARAGAVPREPAARAAGAILWELSDLLAPEQWEQLESGRMLPYGSLTRDEQRCAARFMTALYWWSPWCDWVEASGGDLVLSVTPGPLHPGLMLDVHGHKFGAFNGIGIPYTEPNLRPKTPPPDLPRPVFESAVDRPAVRAARPLGGERRSPEYSADPRFARVLPAKSRVIDVDAVTNAVKSIKGVGLAVPGVAMTLPITLPAGKRQLRDAFDAWAEVMHGEWRKVGASYVLVLEPRRLDAAEMPDEVRERHARTVLRSLVGSFDHGELKRVVEGRAFHLDMTAPQRRAAAAELGLLGYYAEPALRHPKAIQGTGVVIAVAGTPEKTSLRVSLPARAGPATPWLSEPLEQGPGGGG